MPLCLECLSFFRKLKKRTIKKITSLKQIIVVKNDNKEEVYILKPNKSNNRISISSNGSEEIIYDRKDLPNITINDYDKEIEMEPIISDTKNIISKSIKNENEVLSEDNIQDKDNIVDKVENNEKDIKEIERKNNKVLNDLIKELEEKNKMNKEMLDKLNMDLNLEKNETNKNENKKMKEKLSDSDFSDNLTFNIIDDDELINTSYYKNKKLRKRKFKKVSVDSDEEWKDWNELI